MDKLLIEVDYPHSGSNWPNSRKRAGENLAGLPHGEAHQIVEHDARKPPRFDG